MTREQAEDLVYDFAEAVIARERASGGFRNRAQRELEEQRARLIEALTTGNRQDG